VNFKIRTASVADAPAMHRVRTDVRENRLSDPETIKEASYLPYVAPGSAWVAETNTGIVGFAVIDASARRVWALFIDPDAEGTGIGRALHEHMMGWARETGIERLSLSTESGTRAAHFYSQAGWQQSGLTAEGEVLFERSVGS
jgi:GNAT superfamily N-acetyltransferase